MNKIVSAVVVGLAMGTAFADLSIVRECDADEGRGKDGFFVVSRTSYRPRIRCKQVLR